MILEGGCPSSHPILTLSLAYLDVMALWDHNIFLREQVLNSVLRNDVLYLKGGEEAGARALLIRSSVRMVQQGDQGHHWQLQTLILGRVVWKVLLLPMWGLAEGHSQLRCSAVAHLVVGGHQMLNRLAICCGDLLDVSGFLLPQPSQL